jgi:hypothetical protein
VIGKFFELSFEASILEACQRAAQGLRVGFAEFFQDCVGSVSASPDGDKLRADVNLGVFEVDKHDE